MADKTQWSRLWAHSLITRPSIAFGITLMLMLLSIAAFRVLKLRLDQEDATINQRVNAWQALYVKRLDELGLPLWKPWSQAGPFSRSLLDASRVNAAELENYSRVLRQTLATATTMLQYLDGHECAIALGDGFHLGAGDKTTVCLGRAISSRSRCTVPVLVRVDGTFSVWLNGKLIFSSGDFTVSGRREWEMVQLELAEGENELVVKISVRRMPCKFGFVADFGGGLTDPLLAEIEGAVPVSYRRVGDVRSLYAKCTAVLEDSAYPLTEIPVPAGISLEGGGLRFRSDGKLFVGTRRGFVYVVSDVLNEDFASTRFSQFAAGLHEVLGLNTGPGDELLVAQRSGVVGLADRDRDGQVDAFKNLNNEWGLSGNYHEYALDLERDSGGNCFTSLCLSDTGGGANASLAPFRGWIVQITADGCLVPWAFGLRCCNGLGWNAAGDLFATDNQGQWVPACPVYHVRRNHYYGSPASKHSLPLVVSEEASRRANLPRTPPAVWLPYEEFCMSATDIVCDRTDGKFGPFIDQLFVGDMMKGTITRVALELVNDEYQGACFLFRRGVGAVNRMEFGPDHRLYITRAARGWGGGGRSDGLARIEFSGRMPLEIETMKLADNGFDLRFTSPLARDTTIRMSEVTIEQFGYRYWSEYGSPKIDRKPLQIHSIEVADDRWSIKVRVAGLKAGCVCHLRLPSLTTDDGRSLLHADAFYTLNRLKQHSK